MKVKKLAIMYAAACCCLASCMKDELPNRECDIEAAYVHVDNPTDVFFSTSDTTIRIPDDLADSLIIFNNVKRSAYSDLKMAPVFKISRGAIIYPESGTTLDFSDGKVQEYYVISEEIKSEYSFPDRNNQAEVDNFMKRLANDALSRNIRRYSVSFEKLLPDESVLVKDPTLHGVTAAHGVEYRSLHYDFENYSLDSKGKYYEWSDYLMNDEGEMEKRTIPNWSTANAGYKIARSAAKPDEYPTVPAVGQGIDGSDAVLLQTRKTGKISQAAKKPLAAGNLFLGKFDATDPLNHPLISTRFGENSVLTNKPVKFCGYYRYIPGPVMTDKNLAVIPDATDDGSIYCIVYINHDADGKPIVLDGETVDNHPALVAKAEVKKIIPNTTEYNYFQLDFEWYKPFDEAVLAARGYNFSIVCSSSYRGAYFEGAENSQLFVDNFDIIVEKKK